MAARLLVDAVTRSVEIVRSAAGVTRSARVDNIAAVVMVLSSETNPMNRKVERKDPIPYRATVLLTEPRSHQRYHDQMDGHARCRQREVVAELGWAVAGLGWAVAGLGWAVAEVGWVAEPRCPYWSGHIGYTRNICNFLQFSVSVDVR